jgi:multidrug resistance efflux pump
LFVLIVGVAAGSAFMFTKDKPEKSKTETRGPLVEVFRVKSSSIQVKINGNGTVRAKQRTQIVPQVSGRVESIHRNMLSGGFIRSGEALMTIEKADYVLAGKLAQSQVEQAKAAESTAKAQIDEAHVRVRDAQDDLAQKNELRDQGAANKRDYPRHRHNLAPPTSPLSRLISASNAPASRSHSMLSSSARKWTRASTSLWANRLARSMRSMR